jgi:hypothetical protein
MLPPLAKVKNWALNRDGGDCGRPDVGKRDNVPFQHEEPPMTTPEIRARKL